MVYDIINREPGRYILHYYQEIAAIMSRNKITKFQIYLEFTKLEFICKIHDLHLMLEYFELPYNQVSI